MRPAVLAYPNSGGSNGPSTAAPDLTCDSHIHIYDGRFAMFGSPDAFVERATVDDYRLVQRRIGAHRTVIVQPRAYATDNSVTLAAIGSLGLDRARGVAVVRPEVTDAELARMHDGGIRGIRFTLYTATNAATDFSMVEPLAHRVHTLGWHLQLHWNAAQIVEHAQLLDRLPCTIVFDHMARLPLPDGRAHAACSVVRRLIDNDRTWIKLSGAYLDSKVGSVSAYADMDALAQGWVEDAPHRLVWGSDWPHPTEPHHKPDDAQLFDCLAQWVPDERVRQQVLVTNPAELYGFD